MSRVLLVAALLGILWLAWPSPAIAQGMQPRLGMQIGGNLSRLAIDDNGGADAVKSRVGMGVGAFAEVGLRGNFTAEMGLHLRLKGGKSEFRDLYNGSPQTLAVTTKLTYLNVPLLVRYRSPSPSMSIYGQAGPELGFLLAARNRTEGEGRTLESDVKDAYKLVDVGLLGAAGVEVPKGRFRLFGELGGTVGLSNIAAHGGTARNRTVELSAGVTYDLLDGGTGRP